VVGYNWYRWVDTPGSEPPISVGLLTQENKLGVHGDALKRINGRLEAIKRLQEKKS
jgi:hypothetical protein